MDKPWYKSYAPGVPHTINPNQYVSIPVMFEEAFKKYRNSICFTSFGEKLTYRQVDELSQSYAGFLQTECALAKGDRVAIMMPNVLQYPIALFGTLRAGMVNVNISPLHTKEQVHQALKITGAKCILVLSNYAHLVEEAIADTDIKHVIVTDIGDLFRFPKNILFNFIIKYVKKMVPAWHIPRHYCFTKAVKSDYRKKFKKVDIQSNDLAFLQFTEGRRTGVSKCAMLTHQNIVSNILQMSVWLNSYFRGEQKVGQISIFPFFKLAAFSMNCMPFMFFGIVNHLITNPRDTLSIIKQWKKEPISVFSGIRTFFIELIQNEKFCHLDFSKLKFVFAGGIVIPPTIVDRWYAITGVTIIEGYALTEASPMAIVNPISTKEFLGNIGLPIPSTDAKICDKNGQECPIGEKGEIWIKGPQVIEKYWVKPGETHSARNEDGWFKTGDIGTMNEMGFFRLIDRKEDLIHTGQGIVYPSEVENVITQIATVEDAVVVEGRSETGELVIKAYLMITDHTLTEDFILSHCLRHLSNYQIPHKIEFRDLLPKSPSGFILKRQLREEAQKI